MLTRLLASIVKEMLSVARDPRSRQMVTFAPLAQVLVFTFAATLEVRNVDIAVLNQDNGRWSHELVQRVQASSFIGRLGHVASPIELRATIERGDTLLGLHFPADFSRAVAAGETAVVQVIVDGRRANAGQISMAYLGDITRDLGLELQRVDHPELEPPVAAVRHWYNPNLEYRWFILPSLGATLSMMIALMLTVLSIARERELGTYDQLLVSPTTPLEIVASKIIPALLFGFLLCCVVFLLAVWLFGIPFAGSAGMLLLGLLCFLFAVAGIGLTISSVSTTQQQAMLGLFFAMVPLMLISGFVTPVENMPQWLQYVAELSPLKHMIILIQGAFLKGMTHAEMLDNTWPLALIGVVSCTVAAVLVRARME